MRTRLLVIATATIVTLAACGDDGAATGSEGGACYPDLTCDGDLLCLANVCQQAEACEVGSTLFCDCPSGIQSVHTCQADETWGGCECAVCGDGVAEQDEACDGSDLDGASCEGEGFGPGELSCDSECRLDTSGCQRCGNGAIDGDEQCDGAALDGQDCTSHGYPFGTLACAPDCTFDTSGCSSCGDGVLDAGEQCDGSALGGEDCASQGYTMGTLACGDGCAFDLSGCVACPETSAGLLEEVPLTLIVLQDRSSSMSGSRWSTTTAELDDFFADPDATGIEVGMSFFPPSSGTDQCSPVSYYPLHVPLGTLSGHAAVLSSALSATVPSGEFTPTYGALHGTLQFATVYKDNHPERAVVVVLTSDGDPTACDTNIQAIADQAAIAFAYNGVVTHTIAIQGSSTINLGTIAQAGGGQLYDFTAGTVSISQAMFEIRHLATACTYPVPSTVTDPSLLNVMILPTAGPALRLGQAVDEADCGSAPGWYLDDSQPSARVRLCPASCDELLLDPGARVELLEGCPALPN